MASLSRNLECTTKLFGSYFTKCYNNRKISNTCSTSVTKLMYTEFGNPTDVIRKVESKFDALKPGEVRLKMLASPVNPADINTIQGSYAIRPKFPAIAGDEGVGEVVELGPDVKNLSLGDRVIPLTNLSGTWTTHMTLKESIAFKVPTDIGIVEAATLKINPCTAYRMLFDFVKLNSGDTVIQNGANSACGQYIIQLCHTYNFNTVNIVRDRPNIEELRTFLTKLGATYVLTESELAKTTLFKDKVIPKPRLALNCVGGRNALEVLKHVGNEGYMVTYGGMSRAPVSIPTSALIFKDIKVHGFWLTRSFEKLGNAVCSKTFQDIIQLMAEGRITAPVYEMVDFNDYKDVLAIAMDTKGMVGKKYVLKF